MRRFCALGVLVLSMTVALFQGGCSEVETGSSGGDSGSALKPSLDPDRSTPDPLMMAAPISYPYTVPATAGEYRAVTIHFVGGGPRHVRIRREGGGAGDEVTWAESSAGPSHHRLLDRGFDYYITPFRDMGTTNGFLAPDGGHGVRVGSTTTYTFSDSPAQIIVILEDDPDPSDSSWYSFSIPADGYERILSVSFVDGPPRRVEVKRDGTTFVLPSDRSDTAISLQGTWGYRITPFRAMGAAGFVGPDDSTKVGDTTRYTYLHAGGQTRIAVILKTPRKVGPYDSGRRGVNLPPNR